MAKINDIDRRVLGALSGRNKLEALLADHAYPTHRSIAMELHEEQSDVSRCFNNHPGRRQTMDRIRDGLAKLADLTREELDALLGPLDEGA